jgi:probable rRNA maturation factor
MSDQGGDDEDDAAPPTRPFGAAGRRVLVNVEGLGPDEEDLGLLLQGDGMRLLGEAKLEAELSLTLCDGPFIRNLNSQWRGKDQETDVLSFPMDDDVILGDVVICVDVARRQAEEREYELRDEARVLMVRAPAATPWRTFTPQLHTSGGKRDGAGTAPPEARLPKQGGQSHPVDARPNMSALRPLPAQVHGLLHLLGYDHETGDADAAEMREAEERLLRNLKWRGEGLIAAAEAHAGGE